MSDIRYKLTPAQAIELLPDGDQVHTQRNPGAGMFIGADWDRKDLIEHLEKRPDAIEIGGPNCKAMGHAIIVWDDDSGRRPLFIEHDKAKLKSLHPNA